MGMLKFENEMEIHSKKINKKIVVIQCNLMTINYLKF